MIDSATRCLKGLIDYATLQWRRPTLQEWIHRMRPPAYRILTLDPSPRAILSPFRYALASKPTSRKLSASRRTSPHRDPCANLPRSPTGRDFRAFARVRLTHASAFAQTPGHHDIESGAGVPALTPSRRKFVRPHPIAVIGPAKRPVRIRRVVRIGARQIVGAGADATRVLESLTCRRRSVHDPRRPRAAQASAQLP